MAQGTGKLTARMARNFERLVEWEASGLTAIEFCERHGINPSTFGWWQKERARHQERSSPTRALQLVEITPAASKEQVVEVVLGNGVRLRVPAGFERRWLEELLAAVRAC